MTETADAEVSLRNFVFQSVLNEDPTTKSVNILGSIGDEQAIIVADKTAFEVSTLSTFVSKSSIPWVTLLDKNDIYHWFLGGYGGSQATSSSSLPQLKLTLIYPATETHIRKYSRQSLRMVTETAETYKIHVEPFIKEKWGPNTGRINWVYNILEHKKESERIVFENPDPVEGFILLPDLKWDRKTMSALYLMAVTHRRDITSIRDLTKKHIPWLEKIRAQILAGTTGAYPEIEKDQLKLFIHYHPSYYHFHIHVEAVTSEGGRRQAAGKAFLLENIISQLKSMGGGEDYGFKDVDLAFFVGEESELWQQVFSKLKE